MTTSFSGDRFYGAGEMMVTEPELLFSSWLITAEVTATPMINHTQFFLYQASGFSFFSSPADSNRACAIRGGTARSSLAENAWLPKDDTFACPAAVIRVTGSSMIVCDLPADICCMGSAI